MLRGPVFSCLPSIDAVGSFILFNYIDASGPCLLLSSQYSIDAVGPVLLSPNVFPVHDVLCCLFSLVRSQNVVRPVYSLYPQY
jgi:hypothetical protein